MTTDTTRLCRPGRERSQHSGGKDAPPGAPAGAARSGGRQRGPAALPRAGHVSALAPAATSGQAPRRAHQGPGSHPLAGFPPRGKGRGPARRHLPSGRLGLGARSLAAPSFCNVALSVRCTKRARGLVPDGPGPCHPFHAPAAGARRTWRRWQRPASALRVSLRRGHARRVELRSEGFRNAAEPAESPPLHRTKQD